MVCQTCLLVQEDSGGKVSPQYQSEKVEYKISDSDNVKDDLVISIKLKQLVQSIINSQDRAKYSKLKVKFE